MKQSQDSLEARLCRLVVENGGTVNDINRLRTEAGAADLKRIATMLVGSAEAMHFELDYGKDEAGYAAIFTGLADAGQYAAECDPNATPEHFPSQGRRGIQELDIIMFEPQMPPEGETQWLSTEQVLAQMDAAELEPEDALVTLAIAKDKRSDFWVAGLGSVWSRGAGRFVLCAISDGGKSLLFVDCCGDLWLGNWRFPARRKGSRKP